MSLQVLKSVLAGHLSLRKRHRDHLKIHEDIVAKWTCVFRSQSTCCAHTVYTNLVMIIYISSCYFTIYLKVFTFPVSHAVPAAAPKPLNEVQVVALVEALHERVSHIVLLVPFL